MELSIFLAFLAFLAFCWALTRFVIASFSFASLAACNTLQVPTEFTVIAYVGFWIAGCILDYAAKWNT